MSVSVSIPAFAAERSIARTTTSVLRQTTAEFELIIVDDASEDATLDVARRFSDSRIKVYRNETRLGMAANWNRALELAEGDFITLLHSDDELAPEYLTRCLKAFSSVPSAVVVHTNMLRIDSDNNVIGGHWVYPADAVDERLPPAAALEKLFAGNFICCPSVMFRRSLLPAGDLFDPRYQYAADYDAWCRLAPRGDFLFVAAPLLRYRDHDQRQTRQVPLMRKEKEQTDIMLHHARIHRRPALKRHAGARSLHFAWKCRRHRLPSWKDYFRSALTLYPPCLLDKRIIKTLLSLP